MLRIVHWTALGLLASAAGLAAAAEPTRQPAATPDGREIFERVWTANDPRSHGGDGLGPVFNAKSCVACHDQGGAGGGGGFDKNVQLLSVDLPQPPNPPGEAIVESVEPVVEQHPAGFTAPEPTARQLAEQREQAAAQRRQLLEKLAERFHPEFLETDTIVLHAHGTDEPAHAEWRARTILAHRTEILSLGFRQVDGGQLGQIEGGLDGPVGAIGMPVNFAFNPIDPTGIDAGAFPVLAELMNKTAELKQQSHQGTSHSSRFEGTAAVLRTSQRNTTALWGAGLIDRIPNAAIEALAARQQEANGRVSGRPHRLGDGKLGRFGWKGQKATLFDFTVAACANELGLEVPGTHQATVGYKGDYQPQGLDLNEAEVDALVDYLASLPAPRRIVSSNEEVATLVDEGRELFTSIGCAACHVEHVGEVVGLYSDLLLHDLGPDLGSVGSYGVPSVPESDPDDVPIAGSEKPVPPTSREWRTAPLWGVGSSAPYLHDGRAKTYQQAVAFHGGEADESRLRFLLLTADQQGRLVAFLDSLVAPELATR
jgi:CxxC motif-containing protein (DUF1111 family)